MLIVESHEKNLQSLEFLRICLRHHKVFAKFTIAQGGTFPQNKWHKLFDSFSSSV